MILLTEFSFTDSTLIVFILGLIVSFVKGYSMLKSMVEMNKNKTLENERGIKENKNSITQNSENDRRDYDRLKEEVAEVRERSDSNDKEQRQSIQKNEIEIARLDERVKYLEND